MKTATWTLASAVGFGAVFISCIAWLGLWGEASLGQWLLLWMLWCGPALIMMAVDDLRYRHLQKKLGANERKSPNVLLSCCEQAGKPSTAK